MALDDLDEGEMDETFNQEENLLDTIVPGIRILVSNQGGQGDFGIVLAENDDSIVVTMLAEITVNSETGEHRIRQYGLPVPYLRIMKHTLRAITYPYQAKVTNMYKDYVRKYAPTVYPPALAFLDEPVTFHDEDAGEAPYDFELLNQKDMVMIRDLDLPAPESFIEDERIERQLSTLDLKGLNQDEIGEAIVQSLMSALKADGVELSDDADFKIVKIDPSTGERTEIMSGEMGDLADRVREVGDLFDGGSTVEFGKGEPTEAVPLPASSLQAARRFVKSHGLGEGATGMSEEELTKYLAEKHPLGKKQ